MKFGPGHYVPVLKVKQGEKTALRLVAADLKPRIVPLLEIVERKQDRAPTVEKHLDVAFKDLAGSVRAYSRCFLDTREIASDGASAAAAVFQRATEEGILFTPVTGISRSADVAAALGHPERGVALRLTREEFELGGLTERLWDFMAQHGLLPEQTDLIVDLGPVGELIAEGIGALSMGFLADVPTPGGWRTLTIAACSFPESMGGVTRHSHLLAERSEWCAWREGLYLRRYELPRLPTFSDGAIQHPSGVEGFNPRTMSVSAAIRYALPDAWLLIKGESTKSTLPTQQFPRLARLLSQGALAQYFAGAGHCAGCESIHAAANGSPGLGSAAVWRRLGTIHHLTRVVEDLAALPGI